MNSLRSKNVSYDEWNQLLFEHFFGAHNKNKIVYLYVTDDLLAELGEKKQLNYKESLKSFCSSVSTYERGNINTIFEKAKIWGSKWFNQGKQGPPPFIGILSICVLAATRMDQSNGVTSGNYYYRLRELLGESEIDDGAIKNFRKTEVLWLYLDKWLNELKGERGYVNVFQFGQRYIGYPRSQCLVNDSDRKELHSFFNWAGYVPSNIELAKNDLVELFIIYFQNKNNRLARYFKESQTQEGLLDAFIRMVQLEFNSWDGETDLSSAALYNKNLKMELFNHIWFEEGVGNSSTKIHLELFCNVESEYLELFSPCEPFTKVSGYLKKELDSIKEINKNSTYEVGKEQEIRLYHNAQDIYVLERGEYLGIRGWIQSKELMINQKYLLLFRVSKLNDVERWIKVNELKFQTFTFDDLANNGWYLFFIELNKEKPINSNLLDKQFTISEKSSSLSLVGGLKLRNNEWLFDALPTLIISSKRSSVVKINNIESFCMIEPKVSLRLDELKIPKAGIYQISVEDLSTSILLKVDYKNYLDYSNFIPEKHDLNARQIKIAGSYIYDNDNYIEQLSNLFIQTAEGEAMVAYKNKEYKTMSFSPKMAAPAFAKDKDSIGIEFYDFNSIVLDRPIELLLEYLTIKKEGNWRDFTNAVQFLFEGDINQGESINLIAYSIRRNLAKLGMVEFFKEEYTSRFSWKVNPTSVALIPSSSVLMVITGGRTRYSMQEISSSLPNGITLIYSIPTNKYEPIPIYLESDSELTAKEYLKKEQIAYNWEEDYFAYHLLRILPNLDDLVNSCDLVDEVSLPLSIKKEYWDARKHKWVSKKKKLQRIHFNDFNKNSYIREPGEQSLRPIDKEVGKLFSAKCNKSTIFLYSPYKLFVRKEYHLPDLYERCISSCIGKAPIEKDNFRMYENVPLEIALSLSVKLGIELMFI